MWPLLAISTEDLTTLRPHMRQTRAVQEHVGWTEPHSGHSEDISGSQECFASSRRERTRDVSCENQLVLRRELLQHASRLKGVDFRGPLKAISMGNLLLHM